MARTILSAATIFDGSDAAPFEGDVIVDDGRITSVSKSEAAPRRSDAAGPEVRVIDAKGLFLMPGMVDGHSHLSFENVAQPDDLVKPPPEEHTLLTARVAKLLLDQGFTSAYSASEAKLRLAVAIRNEVDAGRLPGPRIRAGSLEISVTGGMGDESRMHYPKGGASIIVDGPEEMRKAVRTACREGCDNIKLDVSGDPFYPGAPASSTPMSFEEVKIAVDTAHSFGRKVNAHTRSAHGTKLCVRAGVDTLFHLEYGDEEMFDLLEQAKDRVIVAPSVALMHTMLNDAAPFGITKEVAQHMGMSDLLESSIKTHSELRKRGIKHVIGGDYGLLFAPNGTNARDIQHFVDYYGYTPAQALVCATRNGGLMFYGDGSLGTIRPGSHADILLVNGNPLKDLNLLVNAENLLLIMKGGQIHKNTTGTAARTQRSAA